MQNLLTPISMNCPALVRDCLPPVARRMVRRLRETDPYRAYLADRVPWTEGYRLHRMEVVAGTLEDRGLLERFRQGRELPRGFGVGIDEGCVTHPWLFAHLLGPAERVLDARAALDHERILAQPVFARKTIHLLAPRPGERYCGRDRVSYLCEDMRRLPTRDRYYDAIACVPPLRDPGSGEAGAPRPAHEVQPHALLDAVAELRRVLRPGGALLVAVPFETRPGQASTQPFDREFLGELPRAFGEASEVEEHCYLYTRSGWNTASGEECASAEPVEWIGLSAAERMEPPPIEPDLAVAARAVACVRLVRPPVSKRALAASRDPDRQSTRGAVAALCGSALR